MQAKSSRSAARLRPLQALRLDRALPAAVVGPLEDLQGSQRKMASDCFLRRSAVHPWAMLIPLVRVAKFGFFRRGRECPIVHLLGPVRNVGLPRDNQWRVFHLG